MNKKLLFGALAVMMLVAGAAYFAGQDPMVSGNKELKKDLNEQSAQQPAANRAEADINAAAAAYLAQSDLDVAAPEDNDLSLDADGGAGDYGQSFNEPSF